MPPGGRRWRHSAAADGGVRGGEAAALGLGFKGGKVGEREGEGEQQEGASLSSRRSAAARHGASARCGGDERQRRWFGRYRGEGDDIFLKNPWHFFLFLFLKITGF